MIKVSSTADIHWIGLRINTSRFIWVIVDLYLIIIPSSLWSSLNLILNLSCLLLVRISDRYSLTNLLIMWAIKWIHLMAHCHFVLCLLRRVTLANVCCDDIAIVIYVYNWVIYSLLCLSFWWRWPISSLSRRDSPLILRQLSWASYSSVLLASILLLLLLKEHLLLYLVLLKLLCWCQIEIVDYICYVCHSIVSVSGASQLLIWLIIQTSILINSSVVYRRLSKPILHELSLLEFVGILTLVSLMARFLFLLATLAWIVISHIKHLLVFLIFLRLNILWCKLFIIIWFLVLRS